MVIITLQQIIEERISFLKEQINPCNNPEENKTLQLQIEAIRTSAAAVDNDIEEVEAIIAEKKALLKNSNNVHEFDRLSAELEGLEWLQRQIARLFGDKEEGAEANNSLQYMLQEIKEFQKKNK
jgi:hypothetical protein